MEIDTTETPVRRTRRLHSTLVLHEPMIKSLQDVATLLVRSGDALDAKFNNGQVGPINPVILKY